MAKASEYKLVEQCEVVPMKTKDTSVPLSFLDLHISGPATVTRQFFYQFPHTTSHFCETTLPTLKHSLSLTLQHYYPLAGNLISPPPPQNPYILCTHQDSVIFTIFESHADFNHLLSKYPKSPLESDPLVPKLTYSTLHDDTFIFPMLTLQATVFPNHGLCIAIDYRHAIDDKSCSHFMRAWSSICRSGGIDLTPVEKSPPCFDREVLKVPKGLEAIFKRDYLEIRSTWKKKVVGQSQTEECAHVDEDYVKATIVFEKDEIERLKTRGLNEWKENDEFTVPKYLSKFVVTCAFVWSNLAKTRYGKNNEQVQEKMKDEFIYFGFAADCRGRLENHVPETYIGNCIVTWHAELKIKELMREGGFLNAVKAIEIAVSNMKKNPFEGAENWSARYRTKFELESTILAISSPKFNVYDTDFGFGRPVKVEMLHPSKCMSLADSGGKEGGIEVGLLFRNGEYEHFNSAIQQGLVEAIKS
ncbi:malonyl-coenzyme A:anthocyanin 3-O-glucoside-6''-O-malonyltransferase-like [Abrus precatorius]|uniref:Malonyl-coenzyme A:anthocyanin 3-O-glucoside-6''-O-malonyltransferase-like n=1 Tax=Abrus precatorius TaxID=3816 RepID=A0A8B8KG56_ABRPR|nr:malonyl-coenzyme A:anthocyanin 3-O-glucoside-6''-O-malonyltransferase-like [Abrus precatorius]